MPPLCWCRWVLWCRHIWRVVSKALLPHWSPAGRVLPWSILTQNALRFYMIVLALPLTFHSFSCYLAQKIYENVGVAHTTMSFLSPCKYPLTFTHWVRLFTQLTGPCPGPRRCVGDDDAESFWVVSANCVSLYWELTLADFEYQLVILLLMSFRLFVYPCVHWAPVLHEK